MKGLKQDVKLTYWDRASDFPQPRTCSAAMQALSPKVKVDYIDPVAKPQLARAAGVREAGLLRVDAGNGRTRKRARSTKKRSRAPSCAPSRAASAPSASSPAAASRGSTIRAATASPALKTLIERETYKTRDDQPAAEGRGRRRTARSLVVGASRVPTTRARGRRLEGLCRWRRTAAGHALGADSQRQREPLAEQRALLKLLEGWGIKVNHDLVLEQSAIGQIAGLGPEVPLITALYAAGDRDAR